MSGGVSDVEDVNHGNGEPSATLEGSAGSRTLLEDLQRDLDQANSQLEAHAQSVAENEASGTEKWVAQVNRLQADLDKSRAAARSVVQHADSHAALERHLIDSSQKVSLLEKELAFNTSLEAALKDIQALSRRLAKVKELVVHKRTIDAAQLLGDVQSQLDGLRSTCPHNVHHALQSRATSISEEVVHNTQQYLVSCFKIVSEPPTIDCSSRTAKDDGMDLDQIISVLKRLNGLDNAVSSIKHGLETAFLGRWASDDSSTHIHPLAQSTEKLWMDMSGGSATTSDILSDLSLFANFISGVLPKEIFEPLSHSMMPLFLERFERNRLSPNVPIDTENLVAFDHLLADVKKLSATLSGLSWAGCEQLDEWVRNAPKVWLARQREHALESIRYALLGRLHETKQASKVETQAINSEDESETLWDNEWANGTDSADKTAPGPQDDDDASAWETPDDNTEHAGTDDGDNDAAWGWDDDKKATLPSPLKKPTERTKEVKQITLQSTFTITGVPGALLDLSITMFKQAKAMGSGDAATSAVGPSIPALANLPTLCMALYRAMAVTVYDRIANGKILLYNDSSWMADQLRTLSSNTHDESSRMNLTPSVVRKLEQETEAFERFARLAYGAEMESQRTILRDLLDGAQGFSNCTTSPFAEECDSAVSMTVDRLRDVHRQWQPVLSKSALLQSTGSLLSTVVAKFIMDIEDLSDIGEDESKRLLSWCKSLSSISDLFMEVDPSTNEARDTTALYCPNWLKLQYLGEILDGTLADIKFLWKEGELSMEFEADEITDLIQALFADSDHRRKAISEIRRR